MIQPAFEAKLHNAIAAKAIDLGAVVHAVGGIEDHIHLSVSVPPKVPLSRFIGEIKGNSSHFVNHIIKPELNFYWQEEYGVVSFREKDLAQIVRYIHKQREHHSSGTVIELLEFVE